MRMWNFMLYIAKLNCFTGYLDGHLLVYSDTHIDVFEGSTGTWVQTLNIKKSRPINHSGSISSCLVNDMLYIVHISNIDSGDAVTVLGDTRSSSRRRLILFILEPMEVLVIYVVILMKIVFFLDLVFVRVTGQIEGLKWFLPLLISITYLTWVLVMVFKYKDF